MTNRGKEGNLEIDAGRRFNNPNNDFTISIPIGMAIIGIVASVVSVIESKYHSLETAYNLLANYFN